MERQILVTGGCGFLGSNLCRSLISDGNKVICLDNLSSGRKQNVEDLLGDSSFDLINFDVRFPRSLPSVDQIYHLASRASPTEFIQYPVRIALANTQGTKRLLDHARACDARFVYASTSEIYGDPEVHPQPEEYTGNVAIRGPRGCYDESKRFGETLTVAYRRQFDLDVRTARIFNTYGPYMRPDDGRVVPTFIKQAINKEDITVYGDGDQTRSFCYVTDLIRGLISLMNSEDLDHSVFNLGNTNEMTIEALAEKILNLTDSDSRISYEPLPEDDPTQRNPDITRAHEELGWSPQIGIDDGLKSTIDHFKNVER